MDVRLSPEQHALRDAAARVADRLGPGTVAGLDDHERAAKLDAAVAATGWRELRVAGDDGAPLASAVEVAVVAEELGRGLADTGLLGPTLAAELRRLAGAPAATAPETVLLRPDLTGLATAAGGVLAEGAVAVDARGATGALALVPGPCGRVLARVGLDPTAASTTATPVDLTRPGAAVAPRARVTTMPDQDRPVDAGDLDRVTALGLAVTCADLVGVMRGAVALATAYAKDRHQYGVAIGSFQAVQHLLADAQVATEGSRSVTLHAAWAADALPPAEALAAAAVAKAYCARAARSVCETAIQVHGGIGNTWECLAHVFLRRALLATDVLGGVGPSLARVLSARGIGDDRGVR
jgi:alkylation response protein AidB-like acyl-CoA dehydrogenase